MVGMEILIEIDATLDRLICNAEAIRHVSLTELSELELAAFQKTQESLLHHLLHLDQTLEAKKNSLRVEDKRSAQVQIRGKRAKFEKLKVSYHNSLAEATARKSEMHSKRRGKRLLELALLD